MYIVDHHETFEIYIDRFQDELYMISSYQISPEHVLASTSLFFPFGTNRSINPIMLMVVTTMYPPTYRIGREDHDLPMSTCRE